MKGKDPWITLPLNQASLKEASLRLPGFRIPGIEEMKGYAITFVLGAGFSRDFAPKSLPLSSDFMAIAEDNKTLKPQDEHKELVDFIAKYFGDYRKVNVESLATFLSSRLLPDEESRHEHRMKLYTDLLEVIVDTVDNVHQGAVAGAYNPFKAFAEFLVDTRANIISFNYDLILDQLLRETGRWSALDGYGIRMKVAGGHDDEVNKEATRVGKSQAKYHKLHGSVNWGKLQVPNPYELDAVYLNRSGVSQIIPLMSTKRATESVRSGENPPLLLTPFIVPPIMSKEDFQKEPFLLNQWYLAKEALYKSRIIFVIGYSFPPTDFMFEFLIRQAAGAKWQVFSDMPGALRWIYVLDYDNDDRYMKRVTDVFGEANYFRINGTTTDLLSQLMLHYGYL